MIHVLTTMQVSFKLRCMVLSCHGIFSTVYTQSVRICGACLLLSAFFWVGLHLMSY